MKARLTRNFHLILNKHLPEQRLYLRTDSSTRFLRLTPGVQATVIAVSAVFFVWTILVSSMFLVDTFAPSSDAAVVRIQQLDFETRLTRLSSERDKRALETQKAQERFYVALDQISSQQSALLRSEDRRREVETGLEVVQRALRKTVKERDRAEIHADTLLAELQSVTGNVSTVSSAAEENGVTLDFLNSALETTVRERDDMAQAQLAMLDKVNDLKHDAKLTTERNQRIFSRLEEAVTVSISPLEKMFENIGLSTDKLLEDVKSGYSGTGGPLTPLAISTRGKSEDATSIAANNLLEKMDKVNLLRIAAERTPIVMPVHSSYRMTSGFGWRRHPTKGTGRMHEGTDFASNAGTPIFATADGVVVYAGWSNGYGNVIKIQHALGFETRFGHLSKLNVTKGQRVSRGDRIGDMGSTGRSTGPHLHYEIRIGGKPVNPMTYIKAARNVF
ncbi:MAG: DUF5930 domain-containing protein [Rhodobacterales bacterium]|nr:peptidoglycan DD-metalloendopeptidase family protein [Rhodobacter sp.]